MRLSTSEDSPSMTAEDTNRDKAQKKRAKNGVKYFFMMWYNLLFDRCSKVVEVLFPSEVLY
jgi:hypothetical protein